ncbi:MAG: ATP-binding protein [Proteobacteria bacterium]|nr:ATP-binding protein [Pseudomonadota bacterium]
MEKEKLKELIIEHKERFLAGKDLIRRELQDDIGSYLSQREIIVFTGVRRCGKSSLMRLICTDLLKSDDVSEKNVFYMNFEDERLVSFTVRDFESLYETFIEIENPEGRKYLFLDEIQNVPGWEKWLNRLYEFEDVKIFVTGSNASLLSSETATALTGRNRQIVVWPFSFREFLRMRGCSYDSKSAYKREKRAKIKKFLREYMKLGGFPEVLKTNDVTLLEQYYRDIIYRDVISRYTIKNIREIKELALYLAANPATIQSYRNLVDIIGGRSINTVKNYISALNDVYLFFFSDVFDYSVKRQIYNPSKTYIVDTAMADAVSFKFSKNTGHWYENLVFLELKRQNKEIYYGRSCKGKEVDFIIKEGLRVTEAIQVCASLSDEKTLQRETQAMMEVCKELEKGRNVDNVQPLQMTIISEDDERIIETERGQVRIIPLWKWLTSEKE